MRSGTDNKPITLILGNAVIGMGQHPTDFQDLLILVDEEDSIIGYKEKSACHRGDGVLHRAFSIFLFNDRCELLLQKRSVAKSLWPLYWSNSVCSHPRKGESYEDAIMRRLYEELGLRTPLHFLYRFQYQAAFDSVGSENELCSVYIGKVHNQEIHANSHEIAEWIYVDIEAVWHDSLAHPGHYTPWFKLELDCIRGQYAGRMKEILQCG